MSATEHDVATALLGTWPAQVAAWGPDAIAAYIAELAARGLTPEQALAAIRTYDPDADFPPSVAKLAQQARKDPGAPTFDEMLQLVYGPRGILTVRVRGPFANLAEQGRALNDARRQRASEVHPLVGSFAVRYGLDELYRLELDHPEFGGIKRRDLETSWNQHVEAMKNRQVATLVAGDGRRGLQRLDPLAVLGVNRPALAAGDDVREAA